MSQAFRGGAALGRVAERSLARPLGIFAAWRLEAYGYTLAALYAAYFLYSVGHGIWLADARGVPIYHDFTVFYAAGLLALHGNVASIYVPNAFVAAQEALVGAGHAPFSSLSYPPIYLLVLAPLAALPYFAAFLLWGAAGLAGCAGVVWLIVRRRPAIAMALASPFAAWNFLDGQAGFLTAALVGAALLTLQRRPVLAGVFIGMLSYKPQFGILFPVALVAAGRWRATASAAVTILVLAALSIVAFGLAPWQALPRVFAAQGARNLMAGSGAHWGLLQTAYGTIRYLGGGASLAWGAQAAATAAAVAIVWHVWRSAARYELKAAVLAGAALIATPYAFVYDLAAIAIPLAFLARDQLRYGFLPGEQTVLLVLFAASLATIPTLGRVPIGGAIVILLLMLILRRAVTPFEGARNLLQTRIQ